MTDTARRRSRYRSATGLILLVVGCVLLLALGYLATQVSWTGSSSLFEPLSVAVVFAAGFLLALAGCFGGVYLFSGQMELPMYVALSLTAVSIPVALILLFADSGQADFVPGFSYVPRMSCTPVTTAMRQLLEVCADWPNVDVEPLRLISEWEQARTWGWVMASGELTGTGLGHVKRLPGGLVRD